jgi:hypothetical protein
MATSKTVGVLWLNQGQDGKTRYFSGYINGGILGDIPIAIFKNRYKNKESDPDFNIVLSQSKHDADEVKGEIASEDVPF